MSRIETGLHAHHASIQASSPPVVPASKQEPISGASPSSALPETPFARVNSVVEGSPADMAGLKAGDRIRRFGTANWMNHEKLAKVAEVVQGSEGVSSSSSLLSLRLSLPLPRLERQSKVWGYGTADGLSRGRCSLKLLERNRGRARRRKNCNCS